MPINHPIQARGRRADGHALYARPRARRRSLGDIPGHGSKASGCPLDRLTLTCEHDYSYGYCPEGCVRVTYAEDVLAERKRALHELGHRKRSKIDRVDKISLIRAYQAVHMAEKYPWGIPSNLITPAKMLAQDYDA